MAVYTEVSDQELVDFLAGYAIGGLVSCKGIAEGVENSNFLLRTTGGTFILTLYEKRVRPEDLPFFLGLMEHLAGRGIVCPQPVKALDGTALGTLAGRPATVVTFLDGMWVKRPGADHCRQLGAALADLHAAGLDFSMTRRNALSIDGWRPLYESCADGADTVLAGLSDGISRELDHLEAHWPRSLPTGTIHADLFTDNVFFLNGRLSGLIDFYFACTDALAYDVAICLNAWCFEAEATHAAAYNVTKGRQLLNAYRSHRRLNDAELDALPLLARGSALRFLLTRLYDWLNTPAGAKVTKKDPLEYWRKLRFHQTVKSVADYGLSPEDFSI